MAAFVKYNAFVEHLAEGVHNLQSNTLKFALSNTAPNASTHSVLADITEISAGNGYSAGGVTATVSTSAQTSGTYKLVVADPAAITASGGSIGPFRYVIFFNDTPTSPLKPLIGSFDYGSSITLAAGESFQIDADQVAGILTLA